MPEKEKAGFLVDVHSEPVIIKIKGRVSFLNSAPLRDFFNQAASSKKRNFVIDFVDCTGMDSTFLGILAGAALDLKKQKPSGDLILSRLGEKNLELVKNLGLHRLMYVDSGRGRVELKQPTRLSEENEPEDVVKRARMVLEAHENLVAAEAKNLEKFQDIITYLKNHVESR
ncbi:MAG: STAS domain-containing protein [Opitutales bacterium]